MSELKPCPFCGKEVEFLSSHFEGNWCVHPPVIHCTACHQNYEGVGIAICDAMDDAKKEDFADNLLCNWWNRRPAEDALTAEVERLKKQVAKLELFLFKIQETSTPHIGSLAMYQAEMRAINRCCKIALGKDTNVPANAPDSTKGV